MANLGRFVELYEVQVAVVAMIYLDLVASTAQLLPYLQVAEGEAGDGGGGAEGAALGSTGAGFGAFVFRLVSRLMQVYPWFWSPFPFGCFVETACCDRSTADEGLPREPWTVVALGVPSTRGRLYSSVARAVEFVFLIFHRFRDTSLPPVSMYATTRSRSRGSPSSFSR